MKSGSVPKTLAYFGLRIVCFSFAILIVSMVMAILHLLTFPLTGHDVSQIAPSASGLWPRASALILLGAALSERPTT